MGGGNSMKAIARWLLKWYPSEWRHRYEDEMSAVIDAHHVTWRTLINLAFRAVHTRLFWERRGIWRTQFLVGSALISFLSLSAYVGVQQTLRQGANWPQRSIASNLSEALSNGESLSAVMPKEIVDVKHSLDPFVIVYNNSGVPIASSIRLNGQTPQLPPGVLEYTRAHGQDILTWQPERDARIAAVVTHYTGNGGGFVLSGRALRVVEGWEDLAFRLTLLAWGIVTAGFGITLAVVRRNKRLAKSAGK
jgi:hypothetical protein